MSRKIRMSGRRAVAALGALGMLLLAGVATPSSGAVFGANQMVVTTAGTATQFELPAAGSSTAGLRTVTINWSAFTGATGYTIYQCERSGPSCVNVRVVDQVHHGVLTYAINGLRPGVAYVFTVIADLLDSSKTVGSYPITTDMHAASVLTVDPTFAGINTSWTAVTEATSYRLERSTTLDFAAATVSYAGPNLTFTDTDGLTPSTMYYYRVVATGPDFTVTSDVAITSTPARPPVGTPTATATATSTSRISVSWTNAASADEYRLERSTSATFAGTPTVVFEDAFERSYIDSGLTANTTYYYRVVALNGYSTATSNITSAKTFNPAGLVASDLTATAANRSQINTSWTSVSGATSYRLERASTAAFTDAMPLYVGTALSLADTGLTPSTTYHYRVIAANASAESTSTIRSVTTPVALATSTLTVTANGDSQIDTSWTAVPGATTYRLERASTAAFTDTVTVYDGTAMTVLDTGLTASTTYHYRVVAGDGIYTSVSATKSATTTAAGILPASKLTATAGPSESTTATANLSWTAVPGATAYNLERLVSGTTWTSVYNGTALTFADTGVQPDRNYSYRATATAGSLTSTSNTASVQTNMAVAAIPAPTAVAKSHQEILVTWSTVSGASSYLLERATDPGFTTGLARFNTGTYWGRIDYPVSPLTTYYYRVVVISNARPGYQAYEKTGPATSATTPAAPAAAVMTAAPASNADRTMTMSISWTAVTGADHYYLYRSASPDKSNPLAFGKINGTSWLDNLVKEESTYYYWVEVFGAAYTYNINGYPTNTNPSLGTSGLGSNTMPELATPILTTAATSATSITASWGSRLLLTPFVSYSLQRSATPDFANPTTIYTGQPNTTDFVDTGLSANTTYYYRFGWSSRGSNSSSWAEYSSATSAITPGTTAGISASTLTANAASASRITTSWSAVAGATQYQLQRAATAAFTSPTTLYTGTATSFSDTGLTANTAYHYRVTATAGASTSTSNIASATTAAPLGTTTLSASAASATQVNTSWTTVAGATQYQLQRATNTSFTGAVTVYLGTGTSYNDTSSVAGNTTYYYRVITSDGTQTSTSNTATVTTPVNAVGASTITATAAGSSQINTSWTAATGADWYTVQRSTSASFSGMVIVYEGAGLAFANTGLLAGTTYYYRVVPSNASSTGTSNTASATTTGSASTVGATTVSADAASASQIDVTWTVAANATSYQLQRSASVSMTSPTIIYTGAATSFSDFGRVANVTYYYRVVASNASSNSTSNVASATTTDVPSPLTATTVTATATSPSQIATSWTAVAGATKYELQRSSAAAFTSPVTLYSGTARTFDDTGLTANTTYYYRVIASNSGYTSTSAIVSAQTQATPLAQSVVTLAVNGPTSITPSWTAVTGATSYRLERSMVAAFTSPVTLYTGTALTFANTGLTPGTRYFYRVVASNAAVSSTSAIVSAPTATRVWPTGINTWRIAVDQSNGDVAVTNRDSENVQIMTQATGKMRTVPVPGKPFGIAIDSGTGDVYAARLSGGKPEIVVIKRGGSTVERSIPLPGTAVASIAVRESDGLTFVSNKSATTNYISVINRGGAAPARNITVSGNALDMALNSDGTKLIVSLQNGPTAVVNLSTWAVTYPAGGPAYPYRPSTDPVTGYTWVPDFEGNKVWALNSAGTSWVTSVTIPTTSTLAGAEVNEKTGDLYVTTNLQEVYVIKRGDTEPTGMLVTKMIFIDTYRSSGLVYGFDRANSTLFELPAL